MWKRIVLFILGLAATSAAAVVYGSYRWRAATTELLSSLEAGRAMIKPPIYLASELVELPSSVQRYFRTVLTDGQPMIAAVHLQHTGTFNMSVTKEQWKPFSSTQRVIIRRPGFDWEARIAMMPGLKVRVHDAYIVGEGILHASLFGLVSVAKQRGTPDAAHGELLRFFAEAAWYPTALLPSAGVRWVAADDRSATATMKDGDTAVTLLFRFNADGLIASVRAEARGAFIDGVSIPTPWECSFSSYEQHDGMCIPMVGEVAWMFPNGPQFYWRGRTTSIIYEFSQ